MAPISSVVTTRLIVALAVLSICLLMASAAWAHAVVLETSPEDGAELSTAPREIWLRFNEPVVPVSVRVLDASGTAITSPEGVSREAETVRVALPDGMKQGGYVISYRVTSGDGHPVAGSIVFGIGTTPESEPADTAASDGAFSIISVAAVAMRALHYGTLLATAGGGLFIVLVLGHGTASSASLTTGLCLTAIVAGATSVLGVGLAGATLQGFSVDGLLTAEVWRTGLASSVGVAAMVAFSGLLSSVVGLTLKGRVGNVALICGALLAAASLAATGHAATAPPEWLSRPLVFVHGLMAAYWVGALWPLVKVLREAPADEVIYAVRRFSGIAVIAVIVLAGAGGVLSVLQLGAMDAVTNTPYGWVWLVKMTLVAALLSLAALNRQRLSPALVKSTTRDGASAYLLLDRSVRTEIAVVAVVVLATASFGLTPPPRALLTQDGAGESRRHDHDPDGARPAGERHGYTTVVMAGQRMATIEIDPAQPGRNRFKAYLTESGGSVVKPLEAHIDMANPGAGIEPITRSLNITAQGTVDGEIDLPMAGRWTLALDVLIDDFEKAVFRTELNVSEGAGP
ncbi:copper transport protein [Skermanella aerolata]|uniref:copper resistance CopC/CopD family protein n=1 Tax=Skermanella aerolata TaxID=393310 RepID=UPI003D1AFBDC